MVNLTHVRRITWQYVILSASILFSAFTICFGFKYSEGFLSRTYDEFRKEAVLAFEAEDYWMAFRSLQKAFIVKAEGDPVVNSLLALLVTHKKFPCLSHESEFHAFIENAEIDTDPLVRKTAPKKYFQKRVRSQGNSMISVRILSALSLREDGLATKVLTRGFPLLFGPWGEVQKWRFIFVTEKSSINLIFKVFPFPQEQSMDININGTFIGSLKLIRTWNEYMISVDGRFLNLGPNRVTFIYKETQSPSKFGSRDTRELAVAFDWIKIESSQREASKMGVREATFQPESWG